MVIKPSFFQFVLDKDKKLALEMAQPPVRFQGDPGEYHVSANAPIFFDWDDIYYLYQFPRRKWKEALTLRYNDFLYEAKKGNKKDIRDVTFTGPKMTIKGINTFATKLLDKIERAVDVDHISQAGKSKEDIKKYQDMFDQYGKEGKDLGGYYGMSLADPGERKDGKETTRYSRGFMFPGSASINNAIQNWLQGTRFGFLDDEEYGTHDTHEVDDRGPGRPSDEIKRVKAARGGTLHSIVAKMEALGAKPFKIIGNNRVAWEVVRNGKLGLYPDSDGTHLPMLLPSKSVRSQDAKAHDRTLVKIKTIENMDRSDFDLMYKIDSLVQEKDEEIKRRVAKNGRSWKVSAEGKAVLKEYNKLKALQHFKNWFSENQKGDFTFTNVMDNSHEYLDAMDKERESIVKNAETYGPHEWNVHMFNRQREPHDPFKVGMENPLEIGVLKNSPIRSKNRGYGSINPNKQSKYMLHGEEGQWENEYKDYFGSGVDKTTGKIKLKTPFNQNDYTTLAKNAWDYKKAIAKKLATHKQFSDFLGVDRSKLNDKEYRKEILKNLTNAGYLLRIIKEKCPGIKMANGKLTPNKESPDCIPLGIQIAFSELASVSDGLNDLKDQVTQGSIDKSAILDGVEKYLYMNTKDKSPAIREALKQMKLLLVRNAENYIRRTIGESAWRTYSNLKKSGADTQTRYRQYLDLKKHISNSAHRYCRELDQLKFDTMDTRRLREKYKTDGYDAPMGDDGSSSAGNISGGDAARLRGAQTRALPKGTGILPDDERNPYRNTRGNSDIDTGTIAHSLDAFNATIRKAVSEIEGEIESKTNAVRAAAAQENRYVLSDNDVDLAKKVGGAAVVFEMFKDHFLQKNPKALDKEANAFAKEKMIEWLKNEKLIAPDEVRQLSGNTEEELKRRIKDRIESVPSSDDPSAANLDPMERVAKKVSEVWDDTEKSKPEIVSEIGKMYAKSDEVAHRVADILSILYNIPPKMDTYKIAAYEPQTAVPNIPVPQEKLDQLAKQLAGMSVPSVHSVANPYMAKKPEQPMAPMAPKTSPLAGFRKTAPTPQTSAAPVAPPVVNAPTQAPVAPKPTGIDLLKSLKRKQDDDNHF